MYERNQRNDKTQIRTREHIRDPPTQFLRPPFRISPFELAKPLNYSPNATFNVKFHIRGGRGGGRRENRSAISRNTWRNFPRGWIPRGASRTNERIRMNACRTMDWLARARNDFIIYLGHDRFQCANRNCLLRRSGGAVNVASSSSRREWQFVSPIKLIASVRDWSRCSDRARSLGTKGVASSPRSSKRMMGWEI